MENAVNQGWLGAVDRIWSRAWGAALGHRCLLCDTRCTAGSLCTGCTGGLPHNTVACTRCALPLQAPADACGACLRKPPPIDHLHAAFVYRPPLDALLPRLKFHADLASAQVLGRLMSASMTTADRPDALVPMPLHRSRLRTRGYDQALELTRPIASALRLPVRLDLLHRVRATAPQSRLDAGQRRRNLRGAFAVTTSRPLPAHVVLVDDVMTTGATLHAAAIALKRAGVARVDAWVCARVP